MKFIGFLCSYLCLTSLLLAENEGKSEFEELGFVDSSGSVLEGTENLSPIVQSISIQEPNEEFASVAQTTSAQDTTKDLSSTEQLSGIQETKEDPSSVAKAPGKQDVFDDLSSTVQPSNAQEIGEEPSSVAKAPSTQNTSEDLSSTVHPSNAQEIGEEPSSLAQATKEPSQQLPAVPKQEKNYPSSARLQAKDGCNLVARGDFLWWKAKEEGLNYASTTIEPAQPPSGLFGATGTVHRINPDYHAGFRAGIGYNVPHDYWDLSVLWTYFHPDNNDAHATAPAGGTLFPYWINENNTPVATAATASWHLHLDILDALIGKSFWAGKYFTFRPQGGFRAAWIDQSLKVKSSNIIFTFSPPATLAFMEDHMSCDFKGYGLNLGLNSKWFFTPKFNLFVNGALSLLWSHFEISSKETLPDNSLRVNMKDSLFSTTPELEMAAGIEYCTSFLNDSCYLQFSLAWEESVWFNLNQMLQNPNSWTHGTYENKTGNLSFTGLTFSTVFGF